MSACGRYSNYTYGACRCPDCRQAAVDYDNGRRPAGGSKVDLPQRPPMVDLPWWDFALCRRHPEVNFFPNRGEPVKPAKQICYACSARKACLNFALEAGERFGIWGGMGERERRAERKRRAQTALQGSQSVAITLRVAGQPDDGQRGSQDAVA